MRSKEGLAQGPRVLSGTVPGAVHWHLKSPLWILFVCTYILFFFFLNPVLQFDPDGYFWAVIHLLCVGKFFKNSYLNN